jgi:hypothetical protein
MTIQTLNRTSFLDSYPVGQIRRNHGLEHATLHVLAQRHPRLSAAGHSDVGGFWILANIPTEEMRSAVEEALQRLRGGESQLAVHPNCGTNFVTAGSLAGLAGALAMFGVGRRGRDKLERLPLAISLATLALVASQPLGMFLQARLTTSGDPASLQVLEIKTSQRGPMLAHRISTRDVA